MAHTRISGTDKRTPVWESGAPGGVSLLESLHARSRGFTHVTSACRRLDVRWS